ncbi:MAG: hypothetical protein JWP27_2857 [Flaviaesturariibacter sp.]|nr:hypothetical protein [Flaviaesturariibacter sp.]
MRIAVSIVRIFVGVLFILSGLVKANDPLGLAYKMEEFFEVWTASLQASGSGLKSGLVSLFGFLHEHALTLSVLMIGLEIIAGVALLLGWSRRFILNLLLLLIVFFTFLTAYAFLSGKFKNCGCFGDCLPISPLTSFIKDIILLVLIIFLLSFQRHLQPLFNRRRRTLILILSLLFTIFFQWYVLAYLPVADCLPLKKGNNIAQQMQMPANAVQDSFAMTFIYTKGGKRYEFKPEELPADLGSYTFVDREQELVRKGNAEPPLKGFVLTSLDGADFTESILNEPRAVLVFALNFDGVSNWLDEFKKVYVEARQKNIPVFVVSSEAAKGKIIFSGVGLSEIVFLNCDYTVVKTAARTNPTFYLLEKGTVRAKESALKAGPFRSHL